MRTIEITNSDYPQLGSETIQTLATPALLTTRVDASRRLVEECLRAIYSTEKPIEGLIPAQRAAMARTTAPPRRSTLLRNPRRWPLILPSKVWLVDATPLA